MSTQVGSIAVLYICTGPYARFWPEFYASAERWLCPGVAKHYFVWTDAHGLPGGENVTFTPHRYGGFPTDSLRRFHTFLERESEIATFTHAVFFNANSVFHSTVTPEQLFGTEPLAAGVWPPRHFYARWAPFYNYERNPRSKAYIPPFGRHYRYYMGCINGGTSQAYLAMTRSLAEAVDADLERGIVACVHDESHLNCYLRRCQPHVHIIPRHCCWPEGFLQPPAAPAMTFVDKLRIDPAAFRKESPAPAARLLKALCVVFLRPVSWPLSLLRPRH